MRTGQPYSFTNGRGFIFFTRESGLSLLQLLLNLKSSALAFFLFPLFHFYFPVVVSLILNLYKGWLQKINWWFVFYCNILTRQHQNFNYPPKQILIKVNNLINPKLTSFKKIDFQYPTGPFTLSFNLTAPMRKIRRYDDTIPVNISLPVLILIWRFSQRND